MKYSNWIGAMLLLCSSALLADQPIASMTPPLPTQPLPVQAPQSFDWHNLSAGPACPIIGGKPRCNVCTDMSGNSTTSCLDPAICCGRASFANAQTNDICITLNPGSKPISDCCTLNGQDPTSQVVTACTGGLVCDYSHPGVIACVPPPAAAR